VVGPPLRVRKRSEKVERRELEVVIEFRFEGIVDSNGDSLPIVAHQKTQAKRGQPTVFYLRSFKGKPDEVGENIRPAFVPISLGRGWVVTRKRFSDIRFLP
jgi:hypothetical protein